MAALVAEGKRANSADSANSGNISSCPRAPKWTAFYPTVVFFLRLSTQTNAIIGQISKPCLQSLITNFR